MDPDPNSNLDPDPNSNLDPNLLKNIDENELTVNISHYKNKINEQELVVANRKQAYDYFAL